MLGYIDLVLVLDGTHAVAHGGIVGKLRKVGKCLGAVTVIGADAFIEQCRQAGVGVAQPAAVGYAVGNVIEFVGVKLVEILKGSILENA